MVSFDLVILVGLIVCILYLWMGYYGGCVCIFGSSVLVVIIIVIVVVIVNMCIYILILIGVVLNIIFIVGRYVIVNCVMVCVLMLRMI